MAAARPLEATTVGDRTLTSTRSCRSIPISPTRAAGLVVLNDWGYARPLVEACNDAGVPTFAKVEGVQDFDDIDTGGRAAPTAPRRSSSGRVRTTSTPCPNRHGADRRKQPPGAHLAGARRRPGRSRPRQPQLHLLGARRRAGGRGWPRSRRRCGGPGSRRSCRATPPSGRTDVRTAVGVQAVSLRDHQGRRAGVEVLDRAVRGDGARRSVRVPQPARRACADLRRASRHVPRQPLGRRARRRPDRRP